MKKAVIILLVFSILLNFFGTGVFNIKANAEAVLITLGAAILTVIGGAVAGALSSYVANSSADLSDNLRQWSNNIVNDANSNALSRGEVIQLVDPGNGNLPYFEPASGLDSYNQKLAEYLTDELNKDENLLQSIANGYKQVETGVGGSSMDAATYSKIKTDATNAAIKFMTAQAKIEGNDALSEVMPSYSFDFVGPIPGITMPTSTGYVQADMNGFRFMTPLVTTRSDNLLTKDQCEAFGSTDYYIFRYENDDRTKPLYIGSVKIQKSYGYGWYSIYNGKIYSYSRMAHSNTGYDDAFLSISDFANPNLLDFMKSSGYSLRQDGCSSWIGLSVGYWICIDPNVEINFPTEVSPNDLIQTTGGETVNINRTDAEDTIGKSISSGIGNENSLIGFDENGNIVSFAGIPIDTLKEALNKIATGENGQSINFDSIEGYLQRIIEILGEINASQAGVQENVNGKTLDEINENLKTITEAITAEAEVVEVDNKFDIKTPETITDKFPFSLPFDIHRMFNLLSAEPRAPKFSFNFDMTSVGGNKEVIEIDLANYENIAIVVRWLIYIAAVIGLILATNKLIGRG